MARQKETSQYDFGFPIRPAFRLGKVEKVLRQVMEPIPTRPTLTQMIRRGMLEGKLVKGIGFIVYEDSLRRWVKSFAAKPQKKKTASRRG